VHRTNLPIGLVFVLLLLLSDAPATQGEGGRSEVSGYVALSSDYVFRGSLQTESGLALQAGLDVTWESGLHVTVWSSRVDYTPPDQAAAAEVDVILGWEHELARNLRLDAGVTWFGFANERRLDYIEPYLRLVHDESLWGAVRYTDSFLGSGIASWYFEANYFVPLPKAFELEIHGGLTTFNRDLSDYLDFRLNLGREFREFRVDLAFWDTDIEGNPWFADEWVVLTLSVHF
jgi:uncharacterized protein (TIGR02001 family)